jgi:hypothetical protein
MPLTIKKWITTKLFGTVANDYNDNLDAIKAFVDGLEANASLLYETPAGSSSNIVDHLDAILLTAPLNGVWLVRVKTDTTYAAVVLRTGNNNFGAILLFGYYGSGSPTHYRKVNGNWTT